VGLPPTPPAPEDFFREFRRKIRMSSPSTPKKFHNQHHINHLPPKNSWHTSYASLATINIWIKSIEGSFDRAEIDLRRPLEPFFLNRISRTESIFCPHLPANEYFAGTAQQKPQFSPITLMS
jgi:hypothetical protein